MRYSRCLHSMAMLLSLLAAADTAAADEGPAFDRPGIAFSTLTIAVGALSLEQGLPDFAFDDEGGVRSRSYSADTTLRFGLAPRLEMQLSGAAFNYQRASGPGFRSSINGSGDLGVALKAALPSGSETLSWAVLGGVTLATGDAAFSAGGTQYDLAGTLGIDLGGSRSLSLYAGVNRLDGVETYTFSPGMGFALGERGGAFIEAGYSDGSGVAATAVAGGGFTWMATPSVQLDISADFGLNEAAADIQGGVGVSVYFD
ncbi:transporter [Tahibacter harae]|uniref:Transporter n=1 Tax=Tahibacter harae TaxID=2963937 RepID=A0ABT1QRK1_9GAMM|nr:transporter [Tahibacter harae]MCQ4164930.1 transporter [Tahibacter harae]